MSVKKDEGRVDWWQMKRVMQWMSVLELGWLGETKMWCRHILYRWKKKINQILKVHDKREALRLA